MENKKSGSDGLEVVVRGYAIGDPIELKENEERNVYRAYHIVEMVGGPRSLDKRLSDKDVLVFPNRDLSPVQQYMMLVGRNKKVEDLYNNDRMVTLSGMFREPYMDDEILEGMIEVTRVHMIEMPKARVG